MKKFYHLALVALVAFAFCSCDIFNNTPEFLQADMQGLWLENGDTVVGHYVRFTDEQSDEANYLYGREWTESEDVFEKDLFESEDLYGNGWFKYYLEKKGDLHELQLMSNSGAEIPKEYIVSKLTDTKLEYYEKDNKNLKYYFTRVVEPESKE